MAFELIDLPYDDTALFDHIGRPNLVGFIFGEPLFATSLFDEADKTDTPAP